MLRTAYRAKPSLNGILALGFLLVLASAAGPTATAVSRSCGEGYAERKPDDGSGGGGGSGLHPHTMKGKFGYVDESGTLIIPARFDGADAFSEGLESTDSAFSARD